MRVLHKSNSYESLDTQESVHDHTQVEEEEEIDQIGIPLKQYPTSGSRARIEDEEREQANANAEIPIELRDHDVDENYDPTAFERGEHIEEGNIDNSEADMTSWVGQPAIKGSTDSSRMALLTLSLIGLQFATLFHPHPPRT